jgi:hypothetical protein
MVLPLLFIFILPYVLTLLAIAITGNKAGAIADLITAANIYRQQQQQSNTDEAMSLVRELKGYKPRPKN